ncbi:hypothetical protein [Yeosuana marina]|uniref:hypothetical protein n=1 Tax=Yeosuana marina TaxID=1565536 RepID=UPI001420DC19|nr:hypothetical protein [Yeosuana marina]
MHNIKNDYRWKNKSLESNLYYSFHFSPEVIRDYSDDSWFLKDYFNYTLVIKKIEKTLIKKLHKRNFIVEFTQELDNSIIIDSLILKEVVQHLTQPIEHFCIY